MGKLVEGGGVGVWLVRNLDPRKSDRQKRYFFRENSSLTG